MANKSRLFASHFAIVLLKQSSLLIGFLLLLGALRRHLLSDTGITDGILDVIVRRSAILERGQRRLLMSLF